MIPKQTIEEIRNRADIIPIVSEYVQIKKRGKNYVGLCPFHSEKTPSFTVSPEKQLWHCFGCGEGGNIFAFVMKIANLDFSQAVELLGERLGIKVEKVAGKGLPASEKEIFFQAMGQAAKYFQKTLEGEEGKICRQYLEKRKIDSQTIKAFGLGLAPNRWDGLLKHLIQKGFKPQLLERVGLAIAFEGRDGFYDRFRNRLIFPIWDLRKRVIGFGGRILSQETPKYLNSPDTPIFNKSYALYGLNLSQEHIKANKKAVLVEGYMDLISCYQNGIKNVAAPLGTALTAKQAQLLRRYTTDTIIAFDTDQAGRAATSRANQILKEAGLKATVLDLKGKKDPDEFLNDLGKDEFTHQLEQTIPWTEYEIYSIFCRYNTRRVEERAQAAREVAALLSYERDPLVQNEYAKLAAEKLNIDSETIIAEARKKKYTGQAKGKDYLRKTTEKPADKILLAEQNVLRLALESKEAFQTFKEDLHWGEFLNPVHQAIAEVVLALDPENLSSAGHWVLENLPTEEAKKTFAKIMLIDDAVVDKKRTIADSINAIKMHHLRSRINNLRLEIDQAEKEGAVEKVGILTKEFNECSQLIHHLQ